MDGDETTHAEKLRFAAAKARDGDGPTAQRLRRRGAERDDESRLDRFELALHPPFARLDLARIGLGMNAPFAARLEFEMFDGVGDIDLGALDACVFQRTIANLA